MAQSIEVEGRKNIRKCRAEDAPKETSGRLCLRTGKWKKKNKTKVRAQALPGGRSRKGSNYQQSRELRDQSSRGPTGPK